MRQLTSPIFDKGKELGITRVGRKGGLRGITFEEDVNSGGWEDQPYEYSTEKDKLPNYNWFEIEKFIERIKEKYDR